MSSEEEAENALYELTVELSEAVPLAVADWPAEVVEARVALLKRITEAVTAYKEQIERRVRAQQPCYEMWHEEANGNHSPEPCGVCPTCTARQTQETSG